MSNFRLYWRLVGISIRSQMLYRASFFILTAAYFIQTSVEFFAIWVLFSRFQSLGGWLFPEIALLYGIVNVAFAVAEVTGRGFDLFGNLVKSGDFDSLLLRPRSTALQVAGQEFQLMRLGRMLQGLFVMSWAIYALPATWNPASLGLIALSTIGGSFLFYGLWIIQAALSFWTTESLEIMNIVTFGGQEAGRYPLSIYSNWFRQFFTYIIPLASVTYFPIVLALQHPGASYWIGWLSPMACLALFLGALWIWNRGERRYCSTGS